ncbi:MAG: YbaL family putative K(+) efflux transporter [Amaricoccus sp.]
MPHDTSLITILVAGLGLAFLLGALANRLRLSPLVGYLLAGVMIGPATPGFVADTHLAPQLAEIGVILLMFGVGLHFSLRDLLSVKAIAIPGALGQIAIATLLGVGLGLAFGWSVGAGLVFGLSLSVASTVVLLRAMQEWHLLDTERGRIAIGWLIVEDLAMVLALVLLPVLANILNGSGPVTVGSVVGPLLLTLAKVGVFVALMLVIGPRLVPWILHRIAGTGSRELFTLAVLAIALGIAYGATALFGVSFALGAFFAGMVLAESELSHRAAEDSLPLRDAFAVLFFVSVGMLFDPAILIERPLAVLMTFLIIVVGKSLAAYAIVRGSGYTNRTALTISVSLAQIGEFSFILATLGLETGLLPAEGQDMILAGAILSITVNPLLFVLMERLLGRAVAPAATEPASPAGEEDMPARTSLVGHAVIAGSGIVGRHLAEALRAAGLPYLVIDDRADSVAAMRAEGAVAYLGNAASPEMLDAANVGAARWVFVAIPNVFEAGQVIERVRRANPTVRIIARAETPSEVQHLLDLGADDAIIGRRELALAMFDDAVGSRKEAEADPVLAH